MIFFPDLELCLDAADLAAVLGALFLIRARIFDCSLKHRESLFLFGLVCFEVRWLAASLVTKLRLGPLLRGSSFSTLAR